jgi:hypothetical protein
MAEENFVQAVLSVLSPMLICCAYFIGEKSRKFNDPANNNSSNIEPLQTLAQSNGRPVYSELRC